MRTHSLLEQVPDQLVVVKLAVKGEVERVPHLHARAFFKQQFNQLDMSVADREHHRSPVVRGAQI